jgi:hypothetical protein
MQLRQLKFAFLVALSLVVTACHIMLLSDYDDVFDQEATNTQKDVDALFQKIIDNPDKTRPEFTAETYAADKDSYAKIRTELDALSVRAQAHQHNENTIASVGKITNSFAVVEEEHKNKPSLHIEAARGELKFMNQEFVALIKEELLKKQSAGGTN